jgi:hypothetical protein
VEFEEVRMISKEEGLLTFSERLYSFKMNSPDTFNMDLSQSMNNNENGEELMG